MRQMSIRCKPPKRKPPVGVDYIGRQPCPEEQGTFAPYSLGEWWADAILIACICLFGALIFMFGFLAGVRYIG